MCRGLRFSARLILIDGDGRWTESASLFIQFGVCEVGSFHDADPHAEAAVER